jgi:hypothetical protein
MQHQVSSLLTLQSREMQIKQMHPKKKSKTTTTITTTTTTTTTTITTK